MMRNEINEIEVKLKTLHEKARDMREEKAVISIVKNPNLFYKFAEKNSLESSKIGPLIKNGNSVSDTKEMADILWDQYSLVMRKPKNELNDEFIENLIKQNINGPTMNDINISQKVVEEAINDLINNFQ